MITLTTKTRPFTRIWPYTPEPSPPLEATEIYLSPDEDFRMSAEPPMRPTSTSTKKDSGILSPQYRPTLDDVLNGTAPSPYTLAAYTAFLSQQHCIETLEFVTESKKYAEKYDEAAAIFHGMPLTVDTSEGFELQQDWLRIMDVYVKPGAPREINLPAEERDELVEESYDPRPPHPEALEPAIRRMHDLMSDSIFIPFCNSVKAVPVQTTYGSFNDFSDERGFSHQRQQSTRRRSPPTSSGLASSRSPAQSAGGNRSSIMSSNTNRHSSSRLSKHISTNSATSEAGLTDDSGSSPNPGDLDAVMSPPLTPPTSDIPQTFSSSHPYSHVAKPSRNERSESGGWKRMGMKIFGQKPKKGSSPQHD